MSTSNPWDSMGIPVLDLTPVCRGLRFINQIEEMLSGESINHERFTGKLEKINLRLLQNTHYINTGCI